MGITVRGVDEVQAGLLKAADDLADPRAAHDEAARIIAAAARPPIDTGRLNASIRVLGPPGARVGSNVRYAAIVEGRTGFLRRAVKSTEPQWMAAYERAVGRICEAV